MSERLARILPFINLILLLISNILTFWTWYNIFSSDGDTDFIGLLTIPLFFVTIYYLGLFVWGIKLAKRTINARSRLGESVILFIINVVPMITIYILTT